MDTPAYTPSRKAVKIQISGFFRFSPPFFYSGTFNHAIVPASRREINFPVRRRVRRIRRNMGNFARCNSHQ